MIVIVGEKIIITVFDYSRRHPVHVAWTLTNKKKKLMGYCKNYWLLCQEQ